MTQSPISPQRLGNLDQPRQSSQFPEHAPAANSVFYRTYSRRGEDGSDVRETWKQVCDRTLNGLKELG
ncbi:MAG: hypothetical protein EA367_19595, partial [Leptolyngbya sp. DLM2.Bin15]